MAVTLKQISDYTGLSVSTISRVVTGKGYVSDEARRTVEQAMADLGYVRQERKAHFAYNNANKVLVMVGGIKSSIASSQVESICQELVRRRKQPIVAVTNFSADLEYDYLKSALDEGFFGIIALTLLETPKTVKLLRNYSCPIIMVGRYLPQRRLDCLRTDYYKVGFDAAEYLYQRGHRLIAFVGGPITSTITQDKVTGFEDCLASHGIEIKPEYELHFSRLEFDNADEVVDCLLGLPELPTAIVSSNDASVSIADGLFARGINIPEDMSIFTCEDSYLASRYRVPLTAMAADLDLMSIDAVKALFRRHRVPDAPYTLTYYDSNLIERDSVASPRS